MPDNYKILPGNNKILPDNYKFLPDNYKILPDNYKNLPDNQLSGKIVSVLIFCTQIPIDAQESTNKDWDGQVMNFRHISGIVKN